MNDKSILKLIIMSVFLGLVMLFFSLDFEIEDAFYETTNDYVFLSGQVIDVMGNRATVRSCRDIIVFDNTLVVNNTVHMTGSMYNNAFNQITIDIIT